MLTTLAITLAIALAAHAAIYVASKIGPMSDHEVYLSCKRSMRQGK